MLPLLLACRPGPAPEVVDDPFDPWDGLEATALEASRHLVDAPIDGAIAPRRVELLETWPLALVLDDDRVHVFDARWHQSGQSFCLPAGDYPYEIEDRSGRCEKREVELSRGVWSFPSGPLDVAWDDHDIWVIEQDGTLHRAAADPTIDNPWDVLRPSPVDALEPGWIDVHDGTLWHASGATLTVGEASHPLPGAALDVQDGVVLTEVGLWTIDGGLVELDAPTDLSGGWAVHADGLTHVSGERHDVAAFAVASHGEHLVALTDEGVWTPDGAWASDAVDVAVRGSEIALLGTDHVAVHFDETRLVGDVALWIAAFAEQPRSPSEDAECDRVREFVDRGARNRELLDDLPASVALGITPHLARRTKGCELRTEFQPVWDADRTEVGVLFHQEPDHCEDAGCASAFLLEEFAVVEDLGVTAGFVSGLSPVTDLGWAWSDLLADVNIARPLMFFGMSVLGSVPHHVDPRAKDPWPQALPDLTGSWDERGTTALAGDNVPAFSLSGCPNTFVRECQALGLGGGQVLDADDVVVLDLLLHRALDTGGGTWSFHLPDLGSWDYTEGCEATDGIWRGECGAAHLQPWVFDVHARFVLNGVADWSTPGEVEP